MPDTGSLCPEVMSTDAVANEVLRQFYLQKLLKKTQKRQSQEVTSTAATQEQQETDNPVNAASGDDEQNDSFETSDGLAIGDDFRVLNSPPMAILNYTVAPSGSEWK